MAALSLKAVGLNQLQPFSVTALKTVSYAHLSPFLPHLPCLHQNEPGKKERPERQIFLGSKPSPTVYRQCDLGHDRSLSCTLVSLFGNSGKSSYLAQCPTHVLTHPRQPGSKDGWASITHPASRGGKDTQWKGQSLPPSCPSASRQLRE